MYVNVHNTRLTYTPAPQHLLNCKPHSPQKMRMRSCMRARCRSLKLLCHGLDWAIANLPWVLHEHCEDYRLPPALTAPPAVSTKPVARRCSLKKSVQIHTSSWRSRRCGVAQASFNHQRWCRPHPVCLWVALALGHGARPSQKSVLSIFHSSLKW